MALTPDPGIILIFPAPCVCISDRTDKPSRAVFFPPDDKIVSKPSLIPISTESMV